MERSEHIGAMLWRRLAYYLALTCLAGIGLGLLGEGMRWSGGVAFAATIAVCAPISLAAVREMLDCLRKPHDGKRSRSA